MRRLRYLIALVLLSAMAAILLYASLSTPWLRDDVAYGYRIINRTLLGVYEQPPIPIGSLSDIFSSLGNHFFILNGRFTAHFLVMLFCGILGKPLFAAANLLAWGWLVWMISILGGLHSPSSIRNAGRSVRAIRIDTVMTVSPLLLAVFSVPMTPAFQISYIWMPALVLTFICLFLSLPSHSSSRRPLSCILMLLLGIVAGNAQETFCIGIAPALLYYAIVNRKSLYPAQWCAGIGFALGLGVIILSPALWSRAGSNPHNLISNIRYIIWHLRIFYLLIIALTFLICSRKDRISGIWKSNQIWIIALLTSFLFNLFVPISGYRQLLGIELYSLIILTRILPSHHIGKWWLAVFWICAFTLCGFRIEDIRAQRKDLEEISRRMIQGEVYIPVNVWDRSDWFRPYTQEIYREYSEEEDYEMTTLELKILGSSASAGRHYLLPSPDVIRYIGRPAPTGLLPLDKDTTAYLIYLSPKDSVIPQISSTTLWHTRHINDISAATLILSTPDRNLYYLPSRRPLLTDPQLIYP